MDIMHWFLQFPSEVIIGTAAIGLILFLMAAEHLTS